MFWTRQQVHANDLVTEASVYRFESVLTCALKGLMTNWDSKSPFEGLSAAINEFIQAQCRCMHS